MQKKLKALDKALRMLALRDHSEREIVEKLARSGYEEREIAETMARLFEYHLLDDAAFAEKWAAGRSKRGLGPWRIRQELRQKGIGGEEIDAALSEIDEDAALAAAVLLARKYLARGDANARRRALDALKRRGYAYGVAQKAIEQAGAELAAEE